MSGLCCAPDAGPSVILVMACPAATGCLSNPLAELRTQVPFVTIATVVKSVCEVFHIVTFRGLPFRGASSGRQTVLRHCAHLVVVRHRGFDCYYVSGGIGSSLGPKPKAVELD
jgi:hypothetical protein